MANCPVPSNPVFTRSGDSVFENVTIWGKTCINGLDVTGQSLFYENATFKKDLKIEGSLELSFLTVKTRLDVGAGGTSLNIDTRTGKIGVFNEDPQQKFQFNKDDNTVVITEDGSVGIGTDTPGESVSGLNTAAQGELKLDIDGTISISRNIYDSSGSAGISGNYLQRDSTGIRWVSVAPGASGGLSIQDESSLIGSGQTFSILNFTQINSLGVGTDTIIPIPNPGSPTTIADIQSQDLWGYTDSGDIYRLSSVGVNTNNPLFTLDVNGTMNVDGATTLNDTLDVDGSTTLNNTLSVSGVSTFSSNIFADAALDVDGATTLNDTLDVDGAATLNSTLYVNNATTLNNTLEVNQAATFNTNISVTGSVSANEYFGDASNLDGLTGAGQGTYGSSTVTPVITVDADGRITNISSVIISGGGGGGIGTGDQPRVGMFFENLQLLQQDYTITTGRNAMSAGPVEIGVGVTVDITSGSTWVVV